MAIPQLGIPELLIILVIVVAVFGAGKIASLGGALGKGVSDFRKAMGSDEKDSVPDSEANAKAAQADEAEEDGSEDA